ncbi:sulphur carrier protein [Mesorhizobium sp. ORS 3324]|nr:sulphur carrier protein [Mesorhizobium sp. ORS 3324]
MKLIVNGEALEVEATTLAVLLKELDYEGGWLATALNGDVVPAAERAECRVSEGDRIEVLSPMQGG